MLRNLLNQGRSLFATSVTTAAVKTATALPSAHLSHQLLSAVKFSSCSSKISMINNTSLGHMRNPLVMPLTEMTVNKNNTSLINQSIRLKSTKPPKLHKSMYDGGDNGGLSYGVEIMDKYRKGPHRKVRPNRNPLGPGVPFAKAVVIRPVVKKPKKPNSANRKCVLVKLSTGKELTAYVPGEGHNLQEHSVVLIRVGNLQDVPGVKTKVVRGKYDLPHVLKKKA